jgi:serine/threonine protein kinase/tetratricopeptide (TPR) repeat protein
MAAARPSLDTIFCAAVEIASEADRTAYIAGACGDDHELRARVGQLVDAHFRAGNFLERPAEGLGATGAFTSAPSAEIPAALGEGPGAVIGPYKLLQQIGEGGMGTVFMAEQTQPMQRRVALKLIKPGMDSAQVIARFEAERQALALMDHPNIARVLDGGATDTGRPYFVMELVKGVPITKYCDEHRLTPRERLGLFVGVCQAVQHAHQKGIIHRDLKPSNVLVALYDGKPVPKVIDFGVAKATGQGLTERTLFTEFGAVVGTLEYMSPEQAELNQLDIDTRSDVYALGALLYELLTGTTPLERKRLKAGPLLDMLRLIREEEPPRPSARISTLGQAATTVSAQRKSDPKRLSQLFRGELDWIVMKALEKDRARRYESASAFAADVLRYLHDEPVEACPPSAGYRARKFLRRHRRSVAAVAVVFLALVVGATVSTRQAIRATLAEGTAQQERDAARAARDAEASERRRAEAAQRQAVAQRDRSQAILSFVEDDLLAQANPRMQADFDRYPDPQIKLRTVVDRASRKIEGKFKGQPFVEASLRKTIADTYLALGESALARSHLERALDLLRREFGEEHTYTLEVRVDIASSYLEEGRFAEAEVLLNKILAVSPDVWSEEHPLRLTALNSLAMAYQGQGKLAKAGGLLEKVVAVYRRVRGPAHLDTLGAQNNLAFVLRKRGKLDVAAELLLKVVETGRRARGEGDPCALAAMNNLLWIYLERQQYALAKPLAEKLLDLVPKVYGDEHPRTLRVRSYAAELYIAQGNDARLEPVLTRVVEVAPRVWGEGHRETLQAMNELALLYVRKRQFARAEPLLARVVPGMGRLYGAEDARTLIAAGSLIFVLEVQGKWAQAEPLRWRRLQKARARDGPTSTQATREQFHLGRNLLEQRKYAEATPLLRQALAVFEKTPPSGWTFTAQRLLGEALAGQKKYADAEPLLLRAYEAMKRSEDKFPVETRRQLVKTVRQLVQLYEATGQKDRAAQWRKKMPKGLGK